MKLNYRAWDISLNDFPQQGSAEDKLTFLLRFAVLAPSGHNTQPWNFSIIGNEVSFWVNRERSLEGSDPERRQLMIAFGCMIENICIAANHYNYGTTIHYFPDAQNHDLVAKISFVKKENENDAHDDLISAIPLRHTNRGKYSDRALPESFLGQIKKYPIDGSDELKLSIITDAAQKHAIADVVNDAQIETMDSTGFREELSHYLKSSFTKEHTGMPGFALEIPAPVSIFASHLVKKINLSRSSKKKDEALLKKYTPAGFVAISSRQDSADEQIASGRLFEKIWLTATQEGLNCSPMAAAIQSPQHREKLKKILDINFEPQIFFRIGYAQKPFRHSPRFLVEQLLLKK